MIGHDTNDDIEAALADLTEEQEDELEEACREAEGDGYWSGRRRARWWWQEAIRRKWLLGPGWHSKC